MRDDHALTSLQSDTDGLNAAHPQRIAGVSTFLALGIAWIATGGSVFLSEVLHWIPCSLCWYQRILMYPLSGILAIGIWTQDRRIYRYALPFSGVGACVSLYHYLIQKTDWLPPPVCAVGVPCTVDYINWFGIVTIPFLAFTAFVLISGLMSLTAFFTPSQRAVPGAGRTIVGMRIATISLIGSILVAFLIAASRV